MLYTTLPTYVYTGAGKTGLDGSSNWMNIVGLIYDSWRTCYTMKGKIGRRSLIRKKKILPAGNIFRKHQEKPFSSVTLKL